MIKYAARTDVSSEKSRNEIERTLARYGADKFMYGWENHGAVIAFRMTKRHVKFYLPLPSRDDFGQTETGRARSQGSQEAAYEQAIRQKWRALALVIKAKLEAVETGITEFEDEFMAHIVLPDGQTVGQWMRPQIETAYSSGDMPALLPAPGA